MGTNARTAQSAELKAHYQQPHKARALASSQLPGGKEVGIYLEPRSHEHRGARQTAKRQAAARQYDSRQQSRARVLRNQVPESNASTARRRDDLLIR